VVVVDVVVMCGIGCAMDVVVVVVMHGVQLSPAVVSKVGSGQGWGSTYLCRNINNNGEQRHCHHSSFGCHITASNVAALHSIPCIDMAGAC